MAGEQDPDGEEGPGQWREFWSSRSRSLQAGWASFRGVERSKEMTPRGSYALGTAGAPKPAPGVVREACGVVGEGGPVGPLAGCTGAGAHRSSLPSGCHLHSAHTCTHTQRARLCTRIDVHVRTRALSHMRTDAHGTMDGQASRRQWSGQIRAPPSGQEPGTRGKWDWLETGLPDSGDAASRCWAGGPHEGRPPCLLSRKQDCSPQKVPYCSGCEVVGC